MKQYHDLKDIFTVLDNADEETIRHLAEHYPSAGKPEMEEVFSMSQKKLNAGKDFINPAEEETYEVQITRSTGLYKSVIAAVACLAVTVGAVGAVANMKRVQPEPELSAAEAVETEAVTEIQTEAQSSETTRKSAETTAAPKKETVMTSVPETLPAVAETVITSVPETVPEIVTTTVQTVTETILTETVPEVIQEEVSVPELETQYIPEIIETQSLPETPQETETPEENPLPGFRVEITEITEPDSQTHYNYAVFAESYETAAQNFDVRYAPTWLPENYISDEEYSYSDEETADYYRRKKELDEKAIQDGTLITLESRYIPADNGTIILFSQILKKEAYWIIGTGFSNPDEEWLTPVTINGKNGFSVQYHDEEFPETERTFTIVWDNGDYVFLVETYANTLADALRIAESVQPVQ